MVRIFLFAAIAGGLGIVLDGRSMSQNESLSSVPQVKVHWIERMPDRPREILLRDWAQTARDFDRVVYDLKRTGEHFPIVWIDHRQVNYPEDAFGLPSFFGDVRARGGAQEAIPALGSVLGALLVGVDKRQQHGFDFVAMTRAFHNRANGRDLVLNQMRSGNDSFWYDLYPGILFFSIASRFPEDERLAAVMRAEANQVIKAVEAIGDDYALTAFDFATGRRVDNGKWREPDGAAGLAWLAYLSYQKFGEPRMLAAARRALRAYEANRENPTYEVISPFAVLAAARLAAEQGDEFDVARLFAWAFEPDSAARPGWGVLAGEWSGYEINGLAGSSTDGGGYAFAMNTFNLALPMMPLPRYDARFARAVGKWMLNAVVNARLFYPDGLPPERQSGHHWREVTAGALPYEGVRREWNGVGPWAAGDPQTHGWGPTDLGIYSGALAGVFGAVISRTSDPAILALDCRVLDFWSGPAYPTHLYYNPYAEARTVTVSLGDTEVDLYDTVSRGFLAKGVSKQAELTLPAGGAAVVVQIPAGVPLERSGERLVANGVVVDFGVAREALPVPVAPAGARVQDVPRRKVAPDGKFGDWARIPSAQECVVVADTGMQAAFTFSWDDEHLYVLVRENAGQKKSKEAEARNGYLKAPWNYDGIGLHFDLANRNDGERYWEVVIRAAFTSEARKDWVKEQVQRSGKEVPRGLTATHSWSGRDRSGQRTIEIAIAWSDLLRLTSNDLRGGWTKGPPPAGFTFGCEPSLSDNGWRQTFWLSGRRGPAGRDEHSLDLRLAPKQ